LEVLKKKKEKKMGKEKYQHSSSALPSRGRGGGTGDRFLRGVQVKGEVETTKKTRIGRLRGLRQHFKRTRDSRGIEHGHAKEKNAY